MIVVSNSTLLIALSNIDLFYLLKKYFGKVFIPREVYSEVVTRGEKLFGDEKVKSADWIETKKVKDKLAVRRNTKKPLP